MTLPNKIDSTRITPKGYEDYRKFEASKTTPNVVIEMIAYSWHSNLG